LKKFATKLMTHSLGLRTEINQMKIAIHRKNPPHGSKIHSILRQKDWAATRGNESPPSFFGWLV
jgi:hypothetical protein